MHKFQSRVPLGREKFSQIPEIYQILARSYSKAKILAH